MAKDPFLEAGIAIPAELPYQDESQRENSAKMVVGKGQHQRTDSFANAQVLHIKEGQPEKKIQGKNPPCPFVIFRFWPLKLLQLQILQFQMFNKLKLKMDPVQRWKQSLITLIHSF